MTSDQADKLLHPDRLATLRALALLDTPTEQALDRLTRLASTLLGVPVALVSLVDNDRQFVQSAVGLPELWATQRRARLSYSFCRHVVVEAAPLIITDAREHPLAHDTLAVPDLGVVAYAGMPLTTSDGHTLGSFCAIDTVPRHWTSEEIATLQDLAAVVMTVIELRRDSQSREHAAAALQQAHDDLERRVTERTTDLVAANAQLQAEIAERVRADTALRSSELRFRSVAESAVDAIVSADSQSTMLYWNHAASAMFGYADHEVLGQPLSMLMPSRYRAPHQHGLHRMVATGEAHVIGRTVELHGRRRDGTEFPLELSLSTWTVEDEVFFTGIMRDITDRVRTAEALRASQQRFQSAFADAPIGMALVALDGTFMQVNHALCDCVGYTNDELIALRFQDITHPDDLDVDLNYRQQVVAGEIRQYQMEKRYIHKLGHEVWIRLSRTMVRHPNGEPMHFIAQIENITTQKQTELDLKQAKASADAGNRAKGEFLAMVSHELRTPLTSIHGALGLVTGGVTGSLSTQAKTMLDIAYKNSERLVRMINDILDIEKIESGKMTFNTRVLELTPLVEQALAANRSYADQFGVSYSLTIAEPGLQVNGDADHLTQVLTNLLANAAKFSPTGGTVEVSVLCQGATVRVAVADHGTGIPDEFRSRIFQKFAQADSSDTRQKGGSGLGLSIAHAIVKEHSGQIGFRSNVGPGTTFYFDLPVA